MTDNPYQSPEDERPILAEEVVDRLPAFLMFLILFAGVGICTVAAGLGAAIIRWLQSRYMP